LREFHQFGIEFLGSTEASIDAEAIIFAKKFFDKLGVKNLTLYINSIGCKDCRKKYQEALKNFLSDNFSKLCPLCQDRFSKNPLRILDCKNEDCKKILENAPSILDYICDDCRLHFEKVKKLLNISKVDFEIDSKIVRGLDYYTKTVFEFVSNNIGAQGTVCGGGRYDGLVEELGGPKVSGIGFAMGIERLLLLAESIGVEFPNDSQVKLYIAPMGEEESVKAFELVTYLRDKGVIVETDHMARGIKAQFKYADKINAKYVGVIGSDELAKGVIKLKDMKTGEDSEVKFGDLYGAISK
ncbi:MAG: histidine--tRNA ligase, partial [Firmicutes bacterium]|nr:histidine--tRNA ligase [Candidatus Caballimonas caccae]